MDAKPTVIVRRVKKVQGGGHHGGSWKVAYADFVTAMMAFFLVMWLVGALTTKQREAVSDYFKNPSPMAGQSPAPAPGLNGPGGASNSMIKLGGTMDLPQGPGKEFTRDPNKSKLQSEAERKEQEKKRLEALKKTLEEAIEKSQALAPFKDQLLLDITSEGLRIQIVDKQNRPMFDVGSAKLRPYTEGILHELAGFINKVPNRITLSGHTDVTAYASEIGYSNWELSADRANAARRSLLEGGMADAKVVRVIGLGSSVLFDKKNPTNPINRRISIVVMTHEAEAAALGEAESLPLKVGEGTAPALKRIVSGANAPGAPLAPVPQTAAPAQAPSAAAADPARAAPPIKPAATQLTPAEAARAALREANGG